MGDLSESWIGIVKFWIKSGFRKACRFAEEVGKMPQNFESYEEHFHREENEHSERREHVWERKHSNAITTRLIFYHELLQICQYRSPANPKWTSTQYVKLILNRSAKALWCRFLKFVPRGGFNMYVIDIK